MRYVTYTEGTPETGEFSGSNYTTHWANTPYYLYCSNCNMRGTLWLHSTVTSHTGGYSEGEYWSTTKGWKDYPTSTYGISYFYDKVISHRYDGDGCLNCGGDGKIYCNKCHEGQQYMSKMCTKDVGFFNTDGSEALPLCNKVVTSIKALK